MATKKIAAPSTTTTAASKTATKRLNASVAKRAPKAVLKVEAKRPSTKAAKERTDAVAVAGKALANAATKPMRGTAQKVRQAVGIEPTVPQHVVKNLKGLREAMDKYPKATGYSTDRKFGVDTVNLHNTRGRIIAEVKLIAKAK
jgi:hypothetical protein